MTETLTRFTTEDYTSKIRKMLDLAENAGTDAEADTFRKRAYELMEKHSISESMLDSDRASTTDEIIEEAFDFRGRFARANLDMAWYVASSCAFGMKGMQTDRTGRWESDKRWTLTLTGWKTDMEKFRVLLASLQIQASRAQQEWERTIGLRAADLPSWDKFKARRSYLAGFGAGVATKLTAAHREAEAAVVRERAAAAGTKTAAEAAGVALVLRSRRESVKDFYDTKHGKLRSARQVSHSGSYGGYNAGHRAGRDADTGQRRMGGSRTALSR
jgi:hypothetical protein